MSLEPSAVTSAPTPGYTASIQKRVSGERGMRTSPRIPTIQNRTNQHRGVRRDAPATELGNHRRKGRASHHSVQKTDPVRHACRRVILYGREFENRFCSRPAARHSPPQIAVRATKSRAPRGQRARLRESTTCAGSSSGSAYSRATCRSSPTSSPTESSHRRAQRLTMRSKRSGKYGHSRRGQRQGTFVRLRYVRSTLGRIGWFSCIHR